MSTVVNSPFRDAEGPGADRAGPVGAAPLDYGQLLRRCMGRAELADRLLASFDARFPTELAQIEQSLAAGDDAAVQRLAHQLKGTAANVSASALMSVAARMDESARVRDWDDVVGGLADARREWDRYQEFKASLVRNRTAQPAGKSR